MKTFEGETGKVGDRHPKAPGPVGSGAGHGRCTGAWPAEGLWTRQAKEARNRFSAQKMTGGRPGSHTGQCH